MDPKPGRQPQAKVGAKLERSLSEVGPKFERSGTNARAKLALKCKHT